MSGSDKLNFIKHYIPQYENESEDKRTIYGAYGPRLFGGTLKWLNGLTKSNQIENVINLLKEKPNSRRAVVQVFSPKDLKKYRREIPCTCTFQFLVRNEKLTMIVNMRSNDAYLGLPHDIFAFTMIQEIVAKSLKRELGSYFHFVGNLHLYENDKDNVNRFLSEGWQSTTNIMEVMPEHLLWESIHNVLNIERNVREGGVFDYSNSRLDPYWKDLVNLVEIHSRLKSGKRDEAAAIKKRMKSKVFDVYIDKRLESIL